MAKCRSCGAEITWITTVNGKKMPVDNAPVNVVESKYGNVTAVTPNGRAIKGRIVGDANEEGYRISYISHFATCPAASLYRNRVS